MSGVPDSAGETFQFLMEEVLHGVELHPSERQELMRYMNERHSKLYGPWTTYFVLGSYESPFKWRLEIALSELNNRVDAYAYLLAPQPDPNVSGDELLDVEDSSFPELKVKFYLHALYADWIVLILEHNVGGKLVEHGRLDVGTLFERTYALPRGWGVSGPDTVEDLSEVRALAYGTAYDVDDRQALRDMIDRLVDDANEAGLQVTSSDLMNELENEFRSHLPPEYSFPVISGLEHYERVGRCFGWLTEDDLRAVLDFVGASEDAPVESE